VRVAVVLALVAGCHGKPSGPVSVAGEFHSAFLGVTLTFPPGWSVAPLDEARDRPSRIRMLESQFIHSDGSALPDALIVVDIQEHGTADAPTVVEQFDNSDYAFKTALADQPGGERVGACDYVVASAIIRCMAHSRAPTARSIIEYTWFIDGRRIDFGITSANPDLDIVRAETDAIARSVH